MVPKSPPTPIRRYWLRFVTLLGWVGFVSHFLVVPADAKDRWTELNIGSFYVYTDSDTAAAREDLDQLEQLRWVLGGLLESKDLPSLWPIRIILTNSAGSSNGKFVSQNGRYALTIPARSHPPLDQVARILIDANTPRLPSEVESGLLALCSTLEARGSRVTWGSAPAHPDLAWARMQLFATKFEYSLSFHIFLGALQGGSDLRAAERNAFGKDPAVLEKEVAANLASGHWEAVPVSGRPLDPKRDFGDHSVDGVIVGVYLADTQLGRDPKAAESAYEAAVEAGGPARVLGLEGLAGIAQLKEKDPSEFLDASMKAGSRSAPVYVAAALEAATPPEQAISLLKKAAQMNPSWGEPVFQEALVTTAPAEKEALLKKATQLDRRNTEYWLTLANVQTASGNSTAAQGSWLRAEDSAATPEERDRVHQLRVSSEQARLDAAEQAQRRDRESVHLADQRAQDNEAARIRAAEQRANQNLNQAAGTSAPENVVPWQDTVPKHTLAGVLKKVECIGSYARLSIASRTGSQITTLLIRHPAESGVSCDAGQPNQAVSVTYAVEEDDRFKTSGTVVSIKFR